MQPEHEADELQALLRQEYKAPRLDDPFSAELIRRLQSEAASAPMPASGDGKTRRSVGAGAAAGAALIIGAVWLANSINRPDADEHAVAVRHTGERLGNGPVALESRNEQTADTMVESEDVARQLRVQEPGAASPPVRELVEAPSEPRHDRMGLAVSEFLLQPGNPPKTETETRASRLLVLESLVETQSLEQLVKEAEWIVVATGVSFDLARPTRPRDSAEFEIRWQVRRTLKGKPGREVLTTRSGPTRPDEIREWYIGTESILILPPEFVAGQHAYAATCNIQLEAAVVSHLPKAAPAAAASALRKEEADGIRRAFAIQERNAYESDMQRLQSLWPTAAKNSIRFLLDRHRAHDDLKGFEWSYWDRRATHEPRKLEGHRGTVGSVALSPDGALLASASADGSVKLWDADRGRELRTLTGHTKAVWGVAFSPDGTQLASACYDNIVRVFDVANGRIASTLEGHTGPVSSVVFSPDGTQLASASNDRTVKLWDLATGQVTLTMKHPSGVTSVAFSTDGQRLASTYGFDPEVQVWSVAGDQLFTLQGHTNQVHGVAFSPDGTRLASASADMTVKVWDAQKGMEILTLEGHIYDVQSVAFSADGSRLASASWDGTVKVWDAATGKHLCTFKGENPLSGLALSRDGSRLASGTYFDNSVLIWQQETRTLDRHSRAVVSVAVSGDGKRLASAGGSTVKVWDAATDQELLSINGHSDPITSVAFDPDGTRLATASNDGTVKIWDAATGREIRALDGHQGAVHSVAFTPRGTRLVAAGGDRDVKMWDAATGKEVATFQGHTGVVKHIALSPNGKQLASAGSDQTVKVWDVATGHPTLTLQGHTGIVHSVAFRADGRQLASAGEDKSIKVWDATTGDELYTIEGHRGAVHHVAFSPDGERLVSASADRTVKLWNTATGREVLSLDGHTGEVNAVVFVSGGQQLVSASSDATVRIWDARPWTPRLWDEAQARAWLTAQRNRVKSLQHLQAAIRTDETISEDVRELAIDWAERFWRNRKQEPSRTSDDE